MVGVGVEVAQAAGWDAGAADEGVEVGGAQPDDASEGLAGELVGIDEPVEGAGADLEVAAWRADISAVIAGRLLGSALGGGLVAWWCGLEGALTASGCWGRSRQRSCGDGQRLTEMWMWS
jgi:hypothetical protein